MTDYNYKIFIVSHGRADKVYTYKTLLDCGISEDRIAIVVDDSDEQINEYKKKFKEVYVMENEKINLDIMDNIGDKNSVIYKRKFCYELSKKLGYRYFLVLDDDYNVFAKMFQNWKWQSFGAQVNKLEYNLGVVFNYYFNLLDLNENIKVVAMAQSGEIFTRKFPLFKRKVMNAWFCDTNKIFQFKGRFNDDVNTYVINNQIGNIFITSFCFALKQKDTQQTKGGMTEIYKKYGTYVKSFYSVICSPSSVKVEFNKNVGRIHHHISGKHTNVEIISAKYKKEECRLTSTKK